MTRKRVFIIGASALIAVSLVYFFARENTDNEREVQEIRRSLSSQTNASTLAAAKRAKMVRAKLKENAAVVVKSSERNDRVQAALHKFKDRTDDMSREQIQTEFDRVFDKKKEFEARPTPTPKEESFVDDDGIHWKKLIYENGAVRYELDEG